MAEVDFTEFTRPLVGMPLTHIWRGYGSAVFLNFGELHYRVRNNGRLCNNPSGEMAVAIEWSWRILCGSWSDQNQWQRVFDRLIGATVKSVTMFSRLHEIDLEFSCGVHIVTFMTTAGDPEWSIFDERPNPVRYLETVAGRLRVGTGNLDRQRVKASDVCILPRRPRPITDNDAPVGLA